MPYSDIFFPRNPVVCRASHSTGEPSAGYLYAEPPLRGVAHLGFLQQEKGRAAQSCVLITPYDNECACAVRPTHRPVLSVVSCPISRRNSLSFPSLHTPNYSTALLRPVNWEIALRRARTLWQCVVDAYITDAHGNSYKKHITSLQNRLFHL